MCGILFSTSNDVTKENFLRGLEEMRHRGPDAPMCCYYQENIKMGHNRLKIVGLNEQSNQPYFSKDKRYVIIYNGEIYNYRELSKQYNIPLESGCDTELIIELSIKIGFEQALQQFNGMFAYVILDTISKKFFAARDRLGVKPLYMYQKSENYIFSSEISAMLPMIGHVELDDVGLRQYRKMRTFFNGYTIYKQIKMFPAGYYMKNNKLTCYWSLPNEEQNAPEDDELKALITSSIAYRQISDVSVGSYLSGGLDSTIVAAVSKELHTYTVGFKEYNEFAFAKLAAEKIGTKHHEVLVTKEDFYSTAAEMIKKRKEPLSVPNEVLLYLMTKEVKKNNTVILSGEGADELFFGYDRIFRWANSSSEFDVRRFSELYSYGSNDDTEIVESVIAPFYKYGKPINVVSAFFQIAHLHGLLRRLDNASMMCSVEARVPFTDYRLVERLAGCPFEWKMQNGIVKAPLKRIFNKTIPSEIIKRKKIGFPVPIIKYDDWLNFNLKSLDANTEV